MIGLDAKTLSAAMIGCPLSRAMVWAPHLDWAMGLADINSPKRAADFIAQLGHESMGLFYSREIWGPTGQQKTYERDPKQPWGPTLQRGDRNFKPWTLGNSQPGDGRRFAGHGPIQITGRTNHAKVRDEARALGLAGVPDFELEPEKLCEERWGSLSAALFWKRHNLNRFSDIGDDAAFEAQTRKINGGINGLADREKRRNHARKALGYAG